MIQNLITGTQRDDVLIGTSGDDHIIAGAGSDYVFAGAGADLVLGGVGIDYLDGEDGDDRLFGGDDDDVLTGGLGADLVSGDGGNDWLYGGSGRVDDHAYDMLLGGAGDDRIYSENPDLIDGGSGDDLAIIVRQDSNVAIKADFADLNKIQTLADGTVISGIERVDFFGGKGDDVIRAGNGADELRGGGGADQLWGGGGTDLLDGGLGRDRLVGGAEGDFFAFGYGSNRDRIIDFVQGEDIINLDSFRVTFDQVVAATTRDQANGIVTINLALLNGAPADRIELLTDPTHQFHLTPADFDLFV